MPKYSKTINLIKNWALYNTLSQNTTLDLLQYIISEIQIIFIILQIYYNHLNQDVPINPFDIFLKDIANLMNNGFVLLNNNSNDNTEITYNGDLTIWAFFLIANVFVYSIMILGGILYVKDSILSDYKVNGYRFLGWCRSWYFNVIFFIVHQLALIQLENILVNNNDNIFTNIGIFLLVLSTILCVCNLVVVLIFYIYFAIALQYHNYYTNHIQLLMTLIFKFGIMFIPFINYQFTQKLISIIWIFCFIGFKIWKYFQLSYYTTRCNYIVVCIFLGMEVCQCIYIIINIVLSNMNLGFIIILSLCFPLISILFYCLFTYRYKKVIFISDPELEADIMSKYLSLKEYTAKGYQSDYTHRDIYEYELIMQGELKDHQNICKNCPLKYELEIYISDYTKRRLYFTNLRLHYLEKILLRGLEKYPKSFELMKELVVLFHDKKNDIIKAMLYLQKLSTLCHAKFHKLVILEYLKIKIKSLHDSFKITVSGLNLECLIKCENFHNGFIKMLKKHTNSTNAFWKLLQDSSVSITAILDQAEAIHKEFYDIEKLWKQYESNTMKYYLKPLYVYSKFLILLKNQEVIGEEYLDKYQKIKLEAKEIEKEEKLTNSNLCSEKNVIINISASKENLGEIVSCTPNIINMLKYDSLKLLKNNISIIMPDIYQRIHNTFIEDFLKTGKGNVLNNNVIRYVKDINNYLIPLNVHIQLMIGIDLKLTFMALLRPCLIRDQAMIVNAGGRIFEMTENLGNLLDLPINDKHKKINIGDICPDIMITITAIVKKLIENSLKRNERSILGYTPNEVQTSNYLNSIHFDKIKNGNQLNMMNLEPQIFAFTQYSSRVSQTQRNNIRFEVNIKLASEYLDELYFFLSLKEVSSLDFEKPCDDKPVINFNNVSCSVIDEADFQTEKEQSSNSSNENSLKTIEDRNPLPILHFKSSSRIKRLSSFEEKPTPIKILEQDFLMSPFNSTRRGLVDSENKNSFTIKAYSQPKDVLETARQSPSMIQNQRLKRYNINKTNEINPRIISSIDKISRDSIIKNNNNDDIDKSIIKEMLCETSSFIGKRSSKKRFMKKIYSTLGMPYDPRPLRLRLNVFLSFLLGSILSSIIIQQTLINRITRIEQDINVVNACNNRLTNYIEMNRKAIMGYAVYTGDLSRKRWVEFAVDDFFDALILLLNDSMVNVISNNTLIRISLPNILDEFQLEFYNKRINLYDYYSNGTQTGAYSTLNTFNAIEQAYFIVQRLLIQVVNGNLSDEFFEDLFFITRNGLNDFLITLQESPNILINDMKKVSSEAITIITFTTIGFSILGIIIFGISITGLIMLYKKNIILLENLLKISKDEITNQIEKLKEFGTLVSVENMIELKKYIDNKKIKESVDNSISKLFIRNTSYLSKKFSYKLIFWKYSLIMTILLGMITTIFGNYFRIFSDFKNRHELLSQRMTNSNFMFYQQCLGLAGIYEYINENGTTYMLNRPIKEVVGELIVNISKFTDFLNIFQTNNGEFDDKYEDVFKGNLCVLYQKSLSISTEEGAKACTSFAGGLVTQGLVTLNTYLSIILNNAYANYEISNKTKQAQFEILANEMFKNFEFLFYFGNLPGYFHLDNLISEEIAESSLIYTTNLMDFAIISSFCLILFLIIIWYPMQKNIRNEGNKVKKMMQVYPKTFLLGNHIIKKFIFQSSNGILGSANDFYNAVQRK